MGLDHDGIGKADYYGGHGDAPESWTPILGNTNNKVISQWSHGEYTLANNISQDDLEVITNGNGFSYRTEVFNDTFAAAHDLTEGAPITTGTSIDITTSGLIEKNTDYDYFEFTAAAGNLSIDISPAIHGANLNVRAELYDSDENLIAVSDPEHTLGAFFNEVIEGGTYYIVITGTGHGDVATTGYNDYGSLGQYTISGTVLQSSGVAEFTDSFQIDLTTLTHNSEAIELGDLDNDGDLDAFVTNINAENEVWINNGGGLYEIRTQSDTNNWATNYKKSYDVALGDVDGDGDLDAIVANYDGQSNQLWLNQTIVTSGTADAGQFKLEQSFENKHSKGVDIGDIDNDGDLDVVFANYSGANTIWLYDSDDQSSTYQEFVLGTSFESSTYDTRDVQLGDLDNDGDLDAFVTNYGSGLSNSVWMNNGSGVMAQAASSGLNALKGDKNTSAALGDFNGDGFLDAFTTAWAGAQNHRNKILAGKGDGTFELVHEFAYSISSDVALADLNNDGDLDAYVTNSSSTSGANDNEVWLGGAGYTFIASADTYGDSYSQGVALGDVNGDGSLDAFVANGQDNHVWLNQPANQADLSITTSTGKTSIVQGDSITFEVTLENQGNETIRDANVVDVLSDYLDNIIWKAELIGGALTKTFGYGDLDEIISYLPEAGKVIYTITGVVKEDVQGSIAHSASVSTPSIDVNAVNNQDSDNLLVNLKSGTPKDPKGAATVNTAITTNDAEMADLDGDGDLDAVVANEGSLEIWENNGSGTFTLAEDLDLDDLFIAGDFLDQQDSINTIALGDLDGDGDIDIYYSINTSSSSSTINTVWFNDGSLNFSYPKIKWTITDQNGNFIEYRYEPLSSSTVGNTQAVELGDLDGDGDLDAFVVNDDGPNKILFNNGSGHFAVSRQDLGNSESTDVALGDLDGDGDLDAFVTNTDTNGKANTIWKNDGLGNFTLFASLGTEKSSGVALADLNSDGFLDAFVTNMGSEENEVWFNNGSGSFSHSNDSGHNLGSTDSRDVILVDINADGHLDAVVANASSGSGASNNIWLGDEDGNFTLSTTIISDPPGGANNSVAVAAGDIDGDGDIDAFFANIDSDLNTLWDNGV